MRIPVIASIVFFSFAALAQSTLPRDDTVRRTAVAGQEVVIRTHASWNGRTCTPHPVPQIVVNGPPQHGTVSVRPGVTTVSRVREGVSESCLGSTMPGTIVAYTPAPGFHGQDQFDYTVTTYNGVYHDTVLLGRNIGRSGFALRGEPPDLLNRPPLRKCVSRARGLLRI